MDRNPHLPIASADPVKAERYDPSTMSVAKWDAIVDATDAPGSVASSFALRGGRAKAAIRRKILAAMLPASARFIRAARPDLWPLGTGGEMRLARDVIAIGAYRTGRQGDGMYRMKKGSK